MVVEAKPRIAAAADVKMVVFMVVVVVRRDGLKGMSKEKRVGLLAVGWRLKDKLW